MSDEKIYDVPADWKSKAYVDAAKYDEMYARSIKDPNGFWGEQASRLDWIKKPTKVKNTTYDPHNVSIKWFEDGTLNACYNCVDRHVAKRGSQTALIWEGDDPKDDKTVTLAQRLAARQICEALKGGTKGGAALQTILDRTLGKPTTTVAISGSLSADPAREGSQK